MLLSRTATLTLSNDCGTNLDTSFIASCLTVYNISFILLYLSVFQSVMTGGGATGVAT
jgi:hypothetical protein